MQSAAVHRVSTESFAWSTVYSPATQWNAVTVGRKFCGNVIHRCLGIAGSIMAQLDKVWSQQRLSLSTKLRIYTSLVQSVVLYGSETWTMRKVDGQDPVFSHTGTASYPWYQMVWQGIQRSSQWENETTRRAVSYCWQTSFVIWSHLSPTGEHTCFAGTATVNRSPHQHACHCWLEAPVGSSTKKLAATSGRRHWPICWCCPNHRPGSFDVEDATTLSWSSAAVSECTCMWHEFCRLDLCRGLVRRQLPLFEA